eukprot:scaffold99_cov422-Pavlova_lutheri.AAC.4
MEYVSLCSFAEVKELTSAPLWILLTQHNLGAQEPFQDRCRCGMPMELHGSMLCEGPHRCMNSTGNAVGGWEDLHEEGPQIVSTLPSIARLNSSLP